MQTLLEKMQGDDYVLQLLTAVGCTKNAGRLMSFEDFVLRIKSASGPWLDHPIICRSLGLVISLPSSQPGHEVRVAVLGKLISMRERIESGELLDNLHSELYHVIGRGSAPAEEATKLFYKSGGYTISACWAPPVCISTQRTYKKMDSADEMILGFFGCCDYRHYPED